MSSTHADATAEPPAAEADEPAIVAEFRRRLLDRYPECDDVSQALAKAEQEPSTTPRHEMPRCPSCATVRISANHTTADGVSWTCTQCRTRFSEPTYSPQTGLDAYGVRVSVTTVGAPTRTPTPTPGEQATLDQWGCA